MRTHLVSLDGTDKYCYDYKSTLVHITIIADDDKAAKEVWVSVVSSLHRV